MSVDLYGHLTAQRVIATLTVCWAVLTCTTFAVSDILLWNPRLVTAFAAVATICHLVLLFDPRADWAYAIGGTAALGTIGFGFASIGLGAFNGDAADAVLLTLSALSLAIALTVLFTRFWLHSVDQWRSERVVADR